MSQFFYPKIGECYWQKGVTGMTGVTGVTRVMGVTGKRVMGAEVQERVVEDSHVYCG